MLSNLYKNRSLISASSRLVRLASTSPATGPSSFKTEKVIETDSDQKPRVVILGSGWGAISFLNHIDTKRYNVSLVSPRNYFLFTPLLPSTPVGTVDEKSIVEPVVKLPSRRKVMSPTVKLNVLLSTLTETQLPLAIYLQFNS
ncbi:hypothetical protein ZYGR_0AI06310 [Zygosaccharomyces rouxii]|uniref:FAD/NAD(P)-binding domain-containing protein n=1 Tax=Zygosaccharomyces rouxii TaxID=4956 RepID=A0A1Q3AC93_ZYGRO|nr:hypothetical protein ZYGR_0AI06310 [Zygosaccharomyces rouxii]